MVIVAGVLLLVVAGVVTVLIARRSRPPPADLTTPAGLVQAYVEAIRAGDAETALALRTRADRARIVAANQAPPRARRDEPARFVVETVSVTDATAEVKVTISRTSRRFDPFAAGTSDRVATVRLVVEDGAWRISQTPALSTFQ